MSKHRKWDELSEREQEQVGLILASLREFSYGFDQAMSIARFVNPVAPQSRFYVNSLYHYLAAYYLVSGERKMRDVLKGLGCGDLLGSVEAILDTPLGDTVFHRILATFRNKFLVHPSFTVDPIQDMHKQFDLRNKENADRFMGLIYRLCEQTKNLCLGLAERFPEVLK